MLRKIDQLSDEVQKALGLLGADSIKAKLAELQAQISEPDFWKDNLKAQEVIKHEAKLRAKLDPWLDLQTELHDIAELATDSSLKHELQTQLEQIEARLKALKFQLMFSGRYDDYDAILRLNAGAGGDDAQDWTQMLERMYLRWAEKNDMKATVIEESAGENAGLKSATISISGSYAYGKLRSEHGVHRLVRLSPFNAESRETSFAGVEILPQIDTPEEVSIDDKDLRIDVYRAGGHGGQSVNTTDSAVRITHMPTGIVVAIQNERSQLQNKDLALKILRSKLAQLQLEQHKANLHDLKGPSKSAEWGNQIRNYILHPYTLVKDARTGYETHDAQKVLDGDLNNFIYQYLERH